MADDTRDIHDSDSERAPGDSPSDQNGRRWGMVEVVLAVALVVLLAIRFGPELRIRAGLPVDAPDLQVATLDGDTIRLAELRGSVVLVNFWATWCVPCLTEMPALQAVREDLGSRGFEVIGLSVDDGPVSDFVARIREDGVRYPLAFAPSGAQRAFGHSGVLPASIVVDREGQIAEYVEGALTEAEIRALVEPYLAAR